MKRNVKQQPIILLVGKSSKENDLIKVLLESQNYSTRETANVFDALDEISDFTVDHCPDVFMLPVGSPTSDFATIKELVEIYSENGEILVTTFSGADDAAMSGNFFSEQISDIKTNINVFPRTESAASANNLL
jgi:PleD family two-component response regulator